MVQQQEILTVQPSKRSSQFYQQIIHSTKTNKIPFKFWSLKEKNPSCARRAKAQKAETLELYLIYAIAAGSLWSSWPGTAWSKPRCVGHYSNPFAEGTRIHKLPEFVALLLKLLKFLKQNTLLAAPKDWLQANGAPLLRREGTAASWHLGALHGYSALSQGAGRLTRNQRRSGRTPG